MANKCGGIRGHGGMKIKTRIKEMIAKRKRELVKGAGEF